jgi:tetratricopeptide (TPR) repeat protein
MKSSYLHSIRCMLYYMGFILACAPVSAQDNPPKLSKPINLDEALQETAVPDRAASYYYFALAKWNERNGDLEKALSQMQEALKYNRDSSTLQLELAILLKENGDIPAAITHAQEASQLDPNDPDPHWVLADIYFKTRTLNDRNDERLQKAVQELEKCRDLDPKNGNFHQALGGAYFELNQPEKAIQAYEKFQEITPDADIGYMKIAEYYLKNNNPEKAVEYLEKVTEIQPESANSGYRIIAEYYLKNNDLQKAVEYLKKAIEVQPNSAESLWALGELYLNLRQIQDALPVYRKLLQLTGNPTVKQRLAELLVESGEYGEAAELLDAIIQSGSRNVEEVRILLARTQIGLKEYSKAIETLQSVRTQDPEIKRNMKFYLGIAYKSSAEYSKAIEIFTELLENVPSISEENQEDRRLLFLYHLTSIYLETKKNEEAIAIGKREYDKNPDSVRMGILYAQILADAGKPDDGVAILKGLLRSNPSEVDLYIQLSQMYLQNKRYPEAEEILHQAEGKDLEGERTEKRLKYQLATVYEEQKDYGRLETLLSGIIASDPEDINAKYYLATVYERQKNYDRAESLFKEVIQSNPKNAGALNYFGYMLADRGIRLNEALKYVQEALAIDPENGAYLDSLGWAYFKLNDLGNAEIYLLQADQRIKDDPVIDDHLGDLYYKIGDLKKAHEFWMQSISIGKEPEEIQKVRRKLDILLEKLRKQEQAEQTE